MTDRIEPASAGDVAAVAAIEREVFTDPWAESAFAGLLGRPHVYFAVAHPASGTATSGYVVAIFAGGEGEIANLAVAPTRVGGDWAPASWTPCSRRPAGATPRRCISKCGSRMRRRAICTVRADLRKLAGAGGITGGRWRMP